MEVRKSDKGAVFDYVYESFFNENTTGRETFTK